MRICSFISLLIGALVVSCGSALAGLRPDELALIVNKNLPESRDLAEFYAQARGVPSGRIIELDLPYRDEIPFEAYEPDVQEPVRQFLQSHDLVDQVRCLVTFYGVPLRIAARTNTPEETAELGQIRSEMLRVQNRLESTVRDLERLAQRADHSFQPLASQAADALAKRADHATAAVMRAIRSAGEAPLAQQLSQSLARISKFLSSPAGDPPTTTPATSSASQPLNPQPDPTPAELAELEDRPEDPAAREILRRAARRSGSPFAYEKLLQDQFMLLTSEHSDSALDSELALLWMEPYPRPGWQPNPLGYPFIRMRDKPRLVMVMRLDAPTPQLVKNLIADSLSVEREGLRGKVVIDSRGLPARKPEGSQDAFGIFDQHLRDLAALIRSGTKLELIEDDKPEVLSPPQQNPISDVAVYCGWYSVGLYVPGMKFSRGAVGYHVASYEMTSLRELTNTGWCRGLLNDGVAATLGPVSEPLLHAFPMPDDFLPLLLTGRLTLAEVYWRTVPLTSWKMCVIGDPLYTPFKAAPALPVDDVPQRLKPLLSDSVATQPER